MKTTLSKKVLTCTLVALAAITFAEIRIPELRQWTSVAGSSLTARFVEASGNNAVLEREDGKRIRISLNRLSLKDRLWIQEWGESDSPASKVVVEDEPQEVDESGIEVPAGSGELSVFSEGKWEGAHAVYEQTAFDAVIDENAVLRLYMKKNGMRVEQEPFVVQMLCKCSAPSSSYGGYRKISEFSSPGKPAIQVKELKFSGKLEDDVGFELCYTFKQNRIEIWGRAIDPKDTVKPTKFRLQFKIAKAFDIPGQMPFDEQEKLMDGCKFTMRATSGEKITCEYLKREKLKRYAKDVVITGPIYGGRKISLEAGDYKKAPLSPYVSTIGAPWEGWSVSMTKEDASSEKTKQKMIITIR